MTRDGWCFAGMNNMLIPRKDDFFYHFRGAVGSIDGSHFWLTVPEVDADRYQSRKGFTSTNIQLVCNHEGRIAHVFPGCEGCAHDGFVL